MTGTRYRCQNAGWSDTGSGQGAIHERDYDDRVRLGEACFPVHGVDAEGATVLRKQLRRAQVPSFFGKLPRCLGMTPCGICVPKCRLVEVVPLLDGAARCRRSYLRGPPVLGARIIYPSGWVDPGLCTARSKGPIACRSRRYSRAYPPARPLSGLRGRAAEDRRVRGVAVG